MNAIANVFGRGKSPQELMREYQRVVNKTVRDLDRSRADLMREETKLIAELKQMAKKNQLNAVQTLAKSLIRNRNYVTKLYNMKAQVQAVGFRLQTLRSTASMAEAMKGVGKAMKAMNSGMKIPQMEQIIREFEKQSMIMETKEDMMNDAVDDAMEDYDDEQESNALVQQIFDEIGLNMSAQIGVPTNAVGKADVNADDLALKLEAARRS